MGPSTSTQRTYRYVRLAIVGAVVLMLVSLAAVSFANGPVTSLSALFYTPGRSVFVGSLFAISLALIALSGHSLEQALLDIAALFAPVIAIVPTPVVTGDAPGLVVDCGSTAPCVPADELDGIQNGMLSLTVVGVLGVALAVVLSVVQRTASRGTAVASAVAGVVVIGMALWALVAPASFVALAHLVATGAFFGIIAVVSAITAASASAPWRGVYRAVAIGIAVVLVLLLAVLGLRLAGIDLVADTGVPWVLVGELAVVGLFALFWIAQTAQYWDEIDPAILAAPIR
jgi:hypothetical protein